MKPVAVLAAPSGGAYRMSDDVSGHRRLFAYVVAGPELCS
jgi:hypothetical protein